MSDGVQVDAPQPRANPTLVGHEAAEAAFLEAFAAERLQHAWLICGPRGIGKATFAYRCAHFLLAQPAEEAAGLFGPAPEPADLRPDPESPVFRRVAAGGHADLKAVERGVDEKTGRRRAEIVVDDVRGIGGFLARTAAEGGWRVVVIDAADEMNRNAANAVLKVLEEPPARAVLLLVAHSPGRLLPTIRSRCRRLTLRPPPTADAAALLRTYAPALDAADSEALLAVTGGSVGRALALAEEGGLAYHRELEALLSHLPDLPVEKVHALADAAGRKDGEQTFLTLCELLRGWLGRLVRYGAGAPEGPPAGGGAEVMDRLLARRGLDPWLEVWEKIDRLFIRAGGGGNLDRKQVVLNALLALEAAARS